MNQAVILSLALTCSTLIHAASEKPSWPIRIKHNTFDTFFDTSGEAHTLASYTESMYYIQKNLPEPDNPTKTLGDFCRQAHASNLPWCFLIARIKNIAPNGEVTTRTRYFDAAAMYTSLYKLREVPSWLYPHHEIEREVLQPRTLLIAKFAHFIFQKYSGSGPRYVTVAAFNHYPDGLTTVINQTPVNDRLLVQLDYTTQYKARKWPYPDDHKTLMIGNLTINLLLDYFTKDKKSEEARKVALFWHLRYKRAKPDCWVLKFIREKIPDLDSQLQKP